MDNAPPSSPVDNAPKPSRRPRRNRAIRLLGSAAVVYVLIAYVVAPAIWSRYVHRHPSLENLPGVTHTRAGIPGDPLNVAIIGSEEQLRAIMLSAKWYPANPLGVRSDLKIAEATVLKRPYDEAPVSNLYLFGRKEDLAYEQPVGPDPRKRHHVRFWRTEKVDFDQRPIWIGSVSFDERVGLSHTTGQITHHISADVDAERDRLISSLKQTGNLSETYIETGFHQQKTGRNGGGDPWHTDGNLDVGVINPHFAPPVQLIN